MVEDRFVQLFGNNPLPEDFGNTENRLVGGRPACPFTGELCAAGCPYVGKFRRISMTDPGLYQKLIESARQVRAGCTKLPETSNPGDPLEEMATEIFAVLKATHSVIAGGFLQIPPETCRKQKID